MHNQNFKLPWLLFTDELSSILIGLYVVIQAILTCVYDSCYWSLISSLCFHL
jgi:hypothetical protein